MENLGWEETIVKWTEQIPLESLREFITSFMSWRTSWPHVHITYLGLKEDKSFKKRLNYALSTVQVSAYNSSERLLKQLILTEPPDLSMYTTVVGMLGFSYWGKRRYEMALSTYLAIMKIYELLLNDWQIKPSKDMKRNMAGTAREYLETLIEVVNNKRKNEKRKEIVGNSKAEYAMNILKKAEFDTNYYLNQIAILEVSYWLGFSVSVEEIDHFLINAWQCKSGKQRHWLRNSC